MKSSIRPATRIARVVACLALLNLAVPGGAIVSFGLPVKAAVEATLAARAKAAKELEARRRKSASRLLTDEEQGRMQGRTGENPYLAGGSKWDVVYKGVDLMTGNYSTSATDMSFDGGYGIPVNVTRSYSANQADEGPFGKGWTLSADVRSTAGGLLKSGSAPVRSIPLSLKERSDAETDPNVTVQPAQAVTAVDAGGTEETVQKDVDGILTTPAWDKNVYDSQYEFVTLNGQSYQVLVSNTVKTPEGTVYTYAKEGTYPNGTVPWNQPNATPQAANVLKVTSATDRQGNVTTYSYGSGTVTFNHANGTTVEHPLTQVSMPGGHVIALTWGQNANAASFMRLVSVSDGPRTVTYTYTGQPGHGLLASATSAGGRTTQYGYGAPYGGGSSDFLTTITDPRGLVETVRYLVGNMPLKPYLNQVSGVIAYSLVHPNGTSTFVLTRDLHGDYGYSLPPGMPQPQPQQPTSQAYNDTPHCNFYDVDPSGNVISAGEVRTFLPDGAGVFSVYLNDGQTTSQPGGAYGYLQGSYNMIWRKDYSATTEDLVQQAQRSHRWSGDGLPDQRRLPLGAAVALETDSVKTHNFMGQPLTRTVQEAWWGVAAGSGDPTVQRQVTRTATVGYAYWGADKYWQQKATRDQAGRYCYTDYYPSTAPAGKRGQTYRVYDPKYGGIGIDANATVPSYAASGTAWRYQVTPAAGQYAAQFDYDSQGRPVDVWKLQKATTSPYGYVRTHTSYGGDGAPSWGQASQVVEDYGGINRTTTTQAYTSWGKASDVVDAAGHEFVTDFDLDGKVDSVRRTDGGLNQTIVSYAYGSSGVETDEPTQVTDGLSGVTQTIAYCQGGGGIGMPASVTETNGNDSYSTSYTYSAAGDRATATYATPSGTTRWGYADYAPAGDRLSPSRVFQTLRRLDAAGAPTGEETHYAYDSAGRLAAAAFAQSPYVDGQHQPYAPATAGAPWYDAAHPASRRAVVTYAYDAGGRLTDVATNWQALPDGGGSYATTGIAENSCAYEVGTGLNRGLKTSSAFTMANVAMNGYDTRTETYGYDAGLDQLTSASYGDGLPNASASWGYDAAGNRNDSVCDNLNRATSLGGASVTNDVLGNRLTKGGTTYGWDCLNRMTSLSGTVTGSYAYRADGMRVSKATGGVTTLYRHDGQMGVEDVETGASGTSVTRYGLGARGVDLIERTNGSGTITAFPIYDAHGNNVASLTRNGSGGFSIGDRRTYDAWGVVRAQQSGGDPKLRYCASLGHKADDESGLVYMRARYYEPAGGRFVSEDPSCYGPNWYIYCSGDPVNFFDITGHSGEGASGGSLQKYMVCGGCCELGVAALLVGIGLSCVRTPDLLTQVAASSALALSVGFLALGFAMTDNGRTFTAGELNAVAAIATIVMNAAAAISGAVAAGSKVAGGLALTAVIATSAHAVVLLALCINAMCEPDCSGFDNP